MIQVYFEFISGMCVGLEFYTGEDLEIGDKFAMQIDLLIIRFTFVFR